MDYQRFLNVSVVVKAVFFALYCVCAFSFFFLLVTIIYLWNNWTENVCVCVFFFPQSWLRFRHRGGKKTKLFFCFRLKTGETYSSWFTSGKKKRRTIISFLILVFIQLLLNYYQSQVRNSKSSWIYCRRFLIVFVVVSVIFFLCIVCVCLCAFFFRLWPWINCEQKMCVCMFFFSLKVDTDIVIEEKKNKVVFLFPVQNGRNILFLVHRRKKKM